MENCINLELFLGTAGHLSHGDLATLSCTQVFPSFLIMPSLGIIKKYTCVSGHSLNKILTTYIKNSLLHYRPRT